MRCFPFANVRRKDPSPRYFFYGGDARPSRPFAAFLRTRTIRRPAGFVGFNAGLTCPEWPVLPIFLFLFPKVRDSGKPHICNVC
jgi:hypothetical protein